MQFSFRSLNFAVTELFHRFNPTFFHFFGESLKFGLPDRLEPEIGEAWGLVPEKTLGCWGAELGFFPRGGVPSAGRDLAGRARSGPQSPVAGTRERQGSRGGAGGAL